MRIRLLIGSGFGVLLAFAVTASPQTPATAGVKEFSLTASRYTFTPSRIVVNQGDTVRLTIRSTDVKHGFAIEAFSVKEVIPSGGDPVTVQFVASQMGTFRFACSEFCGTGHENMGGTLVVQAAGAAPPEVDPDEHVDVAQPDFTVVNLPTNLRVPRHKGAFRVTHRFSRPLGAGDFSDLLSDAFGFDSGSRIALEMRFGLARGTQAGVYRSDDQTIQFFGMQEIASQITGDRWSSPIGVGLFLSIEGQKNFHENYSPAVGLVLSRTLGPRSTVYFEPMFVGNANITTATNVDKNTFLVGLGARIGLTEHVYLVGEASPRVAGYKAGRLLGSFGIEKRVGGHMFQINFSNRPWGSPAQIARGGFTTNDWFIGFNISRKFY